MKEKIYRNIFLNERVLRQENKAIGQLLSILVPESVKESLIQGFLNLSEDQGNVTILFCDIYNFDELIKSENHEIINILDELFRKFDIFCSECHVQKIEVIKKIYCYKN